MKHVLLITSLIAGGLPAADPAPFGHADWKPSPTDPVGFSGQGNNWYPGATPPSEWSDKADGTTRNIRWKVPHPGWTDAQPIVVGKRIIGVYSPHHVVCYDADTGKVLWQDELKLMALPPLSADRKSIGLTPDPDKAAHLQDLFERCLAHNRVRFAAGTTYRDREQPIGPRAPLGEYITEQLKAWQVHFAKTWPEAIPALEQDLKLWSQYKAGNESEYNKATNDRRKGPSLFEQYAEKTTGVSVFNNWPGGISDVMASPVSDGERVYVVLGFGQIAAYDLASGKRLWAFRDPLMKPGTVDHNQSPLLWKDLLLVPSPGEQRARNWHRSIRAYDVRTGALRWETFDPRAVGSAWGAPAWHGFHQPPILGRLPDGPGLRAIVVTGLGHVVDAETGQSLEPLPAEEHGRHDWGAGFACILNGHLYKGFGSDQNNPPVMMIPARFNTQRRLEYGKWIATEMRTGQGPFALSDKVLAQGKVIDAQTGKLLADLGRPTSAIIAGRYLMLASFPENKKQDGNEMLALTVNLYDLADPAKPKPAGSNIIQARGYTPDISGKYFPRFAAEPALRRWGALGTDSSTYQGIGFYYAIRTSGLTAHGGRLYLNSPSWLYCLGESATALDAKRSRE